jgi:predicted MFS family arabinose efflux permease
LGAQPHSSSDSRRQQAEASDPDGAGVARAISPRAGHAVALLLAVSIFNQIDRTILSILQVPIKRDLALSDVQLGALSGLSFAVVYCLLTIPVSRLADRASRTRLMAAALTLWSAMTALSGFATSYLMLVLCRMGLALGESSCSPATLSLLADFFPLRKRAVPTAIWTMSVPIGTMFGLSAGGWLSEGIGWRHAFMWVGGLGLLLAPLMLLLPEPRRGQFDAPSASSAAPTSLREAVLILWRSRAFRFMLLGGTLQSYVFCSIQLWAAPFYARVHHLPLWQAGTWLALMFGLGGGVGALLGGVLSDRAAQRDTRAYGRIPMLGCLAMIPLALVQFLCHDVRLSIGTGFAAVVFLSFYLAPFNASTQSLVKPDMRAFTSAVILVFTNLIGLGLGPLVTGWISDALRPQFGDQSLRAALASSAVVALAAAVAFARAGRHMPDELRSREAFAGQSSATDTYAISGRFNQQPIANHKRRGATQANK